MLNNSKIFCCVLFFFIVICLYMFFNNLMAKWESTESFYFKIISIALWLYVTVTKLHLLNIKRTAITLTHNNIKLINIYLFQLLVCFYPPH